MGKPTMKVGDKFNTNYNGNITVVDYRSRADVVVRFEDGTEVSTSANNIRKGIVRNPNKPSFWGVGYMGVGPYKSKYNGALDKSFTIWQAMIQRCYDPKANKKAGPTYAECSVDPRWHNFQNFAAWYNGAAEGVDDPQLDKDLTVMGNKVYGPDFCSLIPRSVNCLLINRRSCRGKHPIGVQLHRGTGKFQATISTYGKPQRLGLYPTEYDAFMAYKKAKESYVKDVAVKCRDCLPVAVYNNLMNYTVNIDD